MQERKSPTTGASTGGCGLNSTIQERTAQHATVADDASPRFPPMSTAAEAQRYRLIEALRTGPRNSYELRRLGIYQVPARVFELRRQGHDIATELIALTDEEGYLHPRCALYRLVAVAQDVC
ncbi:helix-turn-helix domain-containing protein [Castellaniella sp.]|uniref:helix-turn-helix domain-containing protein n=1 Tax=Castellaniella sp. TaxID=1955812 RepID=UPI003A923937